MHVSLFTMPRAHALLRKWRKTDNDEMSVGLMLGLLLHMGLVGYTFLFIMEIRLQNSWTCQAYKPQKNSSHATPAVLEKVLNNGHVLFMDNFYTTPRLAHYLLQN